MMKFNQLVIFMFNIKRGAYMDSSDGVGGKKSDKQSDDVKVNKQKLDCINLRRCS